MALLTHSWLWGHEAGRNITLIYAKCHSLFATKKLPGANMLAVTRNKLAAVFGACRWCSLYQLATDLLKMSVIILSVVVRTAVGSLLMVAILRPAG